MNTSKINLQKKTIIAFLLALLIPVMIIFTTVSAYSDDTAEKDGKKHKAGVTDTIANELSEGVNDTLQDVCAKFIDALTAPFAPSLYLYDRLAVYGSDTSDKEAAEAREILDAREAAMAEGDLGFDNYVESNEKNFIVKNIFNFARNFGAVLASLIFFYGLFLCLVGRSEAIHDTPFSLFIKYVISMFLIYYSWDIVLEILKLWGNVWTNFCVTGWSSTEKVTADYFGEIMQTSVDSNGNSTCYLFSGTIFSFQFYRGWMNFLVVCLGWFFRWKLIKQMFRLYIECAERYFVSTILLFFFPTFAPSIISNSTSNVFHSYCRMLLTQAGLLCANSLFMKIFIIVLTQRGWTSNLLGYVCGLAFVKFCMKIDAYLASMGLNVAQTGGGMADSIGGSLFALTNALRIGQAVGNAERRIGGKIAAAAVNTGNETAYKVGQVLQGNYSKANPQSFSSEMQKAPMSSASFAGNVVSAQGVAGVQNAARQMHISPETLRAASSAMPAESMNNVAAIRQNTGSKLPSNQAANSFSFLDAEGNTMCTTYDGTAYTPFQASAENSSYMPTDLGTWSDLTGRDDVASVSLDSSYNVPNAQAYDVTYFGSDEVSRYIVSDYAASPTGSIGSLRTNEDGNLFNIKEQQQALQVESEDL